jgi:hypothetical protein
MGMRFRFFKLPGFEGRVAIANLLLIGFMLVTHLIAFPEIWVDVDKTSPRMRMFDDVLFGVVIVLAFPVGWLSMMDYHALASVIFLPLNAYLWGYAAAAIIHWRKNRHLRRQVSSNCEKPS